MLATAAATALAGVSAPAASANSILDVLFTPNGVQISVTAAPNKVNDFEVALNDRSVTVTDPADVIDATGCTGTGTNTVQCSFGPPISFLDILANDLDDSIRVEMSGSNQALLEGNAGSDELALVTAPGARGVATLVGDDGPPQDHGNDTLIGGANGDGLRGGGGTDVLLGGAGNDFLDAEAGSGDRAEAGPGDDTVIWTVGQGTGQFLDGGAGFDELFVETGPLLSPGGAFGSSVSIDLTAGTAAQTAGGTGTATVPAFESLRAFGSVFTVAGTDASDRLETGAADDVVNPRSGADRVITGVGADQIQTRDGFTDRVDCGADGDTVVADQLDELFDCEIVDVAQVLPAGIELEAPSCTVRGVRRVLARKRFLRGLGPRVGCSEPASLEARLTVPVRRRGGRLVTVKAGQLVLAEQARPLAAGEQRLRLRIPRRLRAALGRRFAATLTVQARDQFGNRGTVTRVVRVRG